MLVSFWLLQCIVVVSDGLHGLTDSIRLTILALTDLESGTTKYEQARAKMNMPGDYSIKQLLVDMSSESWI